MGPEISFKSFTRYRITHKKIMDAALLQNIKFSSPPALLWGVVGENALPLPDFSQRCWTVNVPKFRFKCLLPIDNYKPQPHDLRLGQCSTSKQGQRPADSHPSSVHRVSESGESFDSGPICKQTISILTVKHGKGTTDPMDRQIKVKNNLCPS